MPATRADFARGVLDAYKSYDVAETALSHTVRASAAESIAKLARPMGHPAYADLPVGASGHCDAAAVFLDLDGFTGRTFWDPPESMVRLARAVLTQIIEVIADHGGHVLGLRGDGVFACFGGPDSTDPRVDATAAVGACAFALDGTESALNNMLIQSGIEPVRLRAGADHGRLDFLRTGTPEASEVNVIGFAANFAAKCEKTANSWELVAGESLAALIPDRSLLTHHAKSPKTYERNGVRKTYSFYDVRWRSFVPHAVGVRDDLAGSPISRVRVL
jgi:adenylate cyclase